MKITILTLFPKMFAGPFEHSIVKIAKEKKLVDIAFVDIRDFGIGKHKLVDDTPYGGGAGMVMRVDVIARAIEKAKEQTNKEKQKVVLLEAFGKKFLQKTAKKYAALDHLILICGHYEGIDARVEALVDEVITIGDFVLTGGEIPAIAITDAAVRLIPGVIKDESKTFESFQTFSQKHKQMLLDYPVYTKPQTFENQSVPLVLLSGNHQEVTKWREEQALLRTQKRRPNLLSG